MNKTNKNKLLAFKAAKEIALNIQKGHFQRAAINDIPSNYCGFKDITGRTWVIGDSADDLQNPDATINGKPAREVFTDFTILNYV